MSTKVSIKSANLMSFFQIQERKKKRRRQFFCRRRKEITETASTFTSGNANCWGKLERLSRTAWQNRRSKIGDPFEHAAATVGLHFKKKKKKNNEILWNEKQKLQVEVTLNNDWQYVACKHIRINLESQFDQLQQNQVLESNSRIRAPWRITTMDFNKKNLRKCRMGQIDVCYQQKWMYIDHKEWQTRSYTSIPKLTETIRIHESNLLTIHSNIMTNIPMTFF